MTEWNREGLRIEFFHDCLSAWCYKTSALLRDFVAEHPEIEVIQRSYPLSTSPDFSGLFASKAALKEEVLMIHWAEARDVAEDPRINPELMMSRPFDYPYSLPNMLGAKAAEMQAGQAGHWDFFDRVQVAHLTECNNIADDGVLRDCAAEIGLDVSRWEQDYRSAQARALLAEDMAIAERYGVLRVPALVAEGRFQLPGRPMSILGYFVNAEDIQRWYDDIQRRRVLGYTLPPQE